MNSEIKLFNTKINNLSMSETISLVEQAIKTNSQLHHTVVNAAKLVAAQKDLELRKSINGSDIVNADGLAVVWAANFLGSNLKERVAGIDLMENLVLLAHKQHYKIYLFGATEEVVSQLVQIYTQKYGTALIAGFRNGYFTPEQEESVVQEISASKANLLFVAMSSPKKEIFLHRYKTQLQDINFIMGVGGSFDVFAGKTKRAPLWMQKLGFEWFFRFLQEPQRMWKRYLVGNTKFILLVLKEKFQS